MLRMAILLICHSVLGINFAIACTVMFSYYDDNGMSLYSTQCKSTSTATCKMILQHARLTLHISDVVQGIIYKSRVGCKSGSKWTNYSSFL